MLVNFFLTYVYRIVLDFILAVMDSFIRKWFARESLGRSGNKLLLFIRWRSR